MGIVDVDRAVARFERQLDKIMACTSGMPNYEAVAAKVEPLRAALRAIKAPEKAFRVEVA